MDRLLRNIEKYQKVIISGDMESEILSQMVYELIVGKFTEMCTFYKKHRMLTYSPKYKYFDMFYEDNHKSKYRKFKNMDNYVLRVRGINGYNIDGLGLNDSHPIFYDGNLIIFIYKGEAKIMGDLFNKKLRILETDDYYRSYKLSKILNKINGNSNS